MPELKYPTIWIVSVLHGPSPMVGITSWSGWHIRSAALVAALILLASPARAGCSLDDLGNGFIGTAAAAYACESVYKNDATRVAAIALTAALSGVAAEGSDTGKGQAMVDQFCSEAQGTADQIVSKLNTIFGNAIAKEVLGDLSDQLAAVGAAAEVVKCSCKSEQSTISLGSTASECIQEGLCSIGIDWGCSCKPPPPQTAQCPSLDTEACKGKSVVQKMHDPACIPAGSIANCNATWQQCGYEGYSPSVVKVETPEGALAIRVPSSAEGTGCEAVQTCFCPKPMQLSWNEIPNPGSGDHRYILSCDCPAGTHPGLTVQNGISSCLCDGTEKPAAFGFAPLEMCPPPDCPAGQTRLGLDGACVAPCADPAMGMAFDGSCCNPGQMTSCGECCPPDTVPDPKKGTCVPRPKPPK